jgi:hypothetical protein
MAGRHAAEAILESQKAPRGATFEENGRLYRVLTEAEANDYQRELAAAPDDPAIRGAIAEKYSLFAEAEKEYRKLDTAEGRRRLQELEIFRDVPRK